MHLMESILQVEDTIQAVNSLLIDEIFDDRDGIAIIFGLAVKVAVVNY